MKVIFQLITVFVYIIVIIAKKLHELLEFVLSDQNILRNYIRLEIPYIAGICIISSQLYCENTRLEIVGICII